VSGCLSSVRGHHVWVPSSPYWPRWPVAGCLSPACADPRLPLASRCCSRCPLGRLPLSKPRLPVVVVVLPRWSCCARARGQRGVMSVSWPANRSTVHVSPLALVFRLGVSHPMRVSSSYRSEVTRLLTSPSSHATLFISPRWSAAIGGAASAK
jgi:hypothetical protein